jgi:hypothetical protein
MIKDKKIKSWIAFPALGKVEGVVRTPHGFMPFKASYRDVLFPDRLQILPVRKRDKVLWRLAPEVVAREISDKINQKWTPAWNQCGPLITAAKEMKNIPNIQLELETKHIPIKKQIDYINITCSTAVKSNCYIKIHLNSKKKMEYVIENLHIYSKSPKQLAHKFKTFLSRLIWLEKATAAIMKQEYRGSLKGNAVVLPDFPHHTSPYPDWKIYIYETREQSRGGQRYYIKKLHTGQWEAESFCRLDSSQSVYNRTQGSDIKTLFKQTFCRHVQNLEKHTFLVSERSKS